MKSSERICGTCYWFDGHMCVQTTHACYPNWTCENEYHFGAVWMPLVNGRNVGQDFDIWQESQREKKNIDNS